MASIGILQIALFFGLVFLFTKPLGAYMAQVFEGRRTLLHPALRWLEVLTYRVSGVRENTEQRWTQYTASLLSFSIFGFLLVYLIQRLQGFLPFNPQHMTAGNVSPDLAFSTAASFVSNTNWQSYGGESTLSYFVQMGALTVQNFASAAAGMALAHRNAPSMNPNVPAALVPRFSVVEVMVLHKQLIGPPEQPAGLGDGRRRQRRIALERGRIIGGKNDDCGSEDQQEKEKAEKHAGFSDQFKDGCGWVCCNIVTCDLCRICGTC